MFKLPIVSLERKQGGRMFSIRDFRRLYREVEINEIVSLRNFFSEIFKIILSDGNTFETRLIDRWNSLSTNISPRDVENALEVLQVLKKDNKPLKYVDFKKGESFVYFSNIVYTIRNAIVHNKETEFHLSYATLDHPICVLIENMLLPSLEEICFELIGTNNPHVWYKNKELVLY